MNRKLSWRKLTVSSERPLHSATVLRMSFFSSFFQFFQQTFPCFCFLSFGSFYLKETVLRDKANTFYRNVIFWLGTAASVFNSSDNINNLISTTFVQFTLENFSWILIEIISPIDQFFCKPPKTNWKKGVDLFQYFPKYFKKLIQVKFEKQAISRKGFQHKYKKNTKTTLY